MNSIEECNNLILLLKEALKFYADNKNYRGHTSASTCGTPTSLIEMDEGSQARFALDKVKQMVDINLKMQDEYDKYMAGYEQLQANEGIADPEELIKIYTQTHDDKNIR